MDLLVTTEMEIRFPSKEIEQLKALPMRTVDRGRIEQRKIDGVWWYREGNALSNQLTSRMIGSLKEL